MKQNGQGKAKKSYSSGSADPLRIKPGMARQYSER